MVKTEDEIIEEIAIDSLETDDYYQAKSTDLISAVQLKNQHLEKIKNDLKEGPERKAITRAFEWIEDDIESVLNNEELNDFYFDLNKMNTLSEEAQEKLANTEEAFTLSQAYDLSPDFLKHIYTLAYQYYQEKEYDQAIDLLILLNVLDPYVLEFISLKGVCHLDKKEWTEAISTFSQVLILDPDDALAHISKALAHLRLKNKDEAREEMKILEALFEEHPELEEVWLKPLKKIKKRVK